MEKRLLDYLTKMDALEALESGAKGVRVSLQCPGAPAPGSRAERRASLEQQFATIAEGLTSKGARVDLDTISVSAQTVEAVLPVDGYDDVKHDLEQNGIRVDPVVDRQIV